MTTTQETAAPTDEAGSVTDLGAVRAPRRPALSPSRAGDFMQCPLLFRYRVVDRLPEPPSSAAARGTLVHSVLERLYDAPLGQRTREAALALLPGEWDRLLEAEPRYGELFAPGGDAAGSTPEGWLDGAGRLLGTYFTLEDPNRLEPEARELRVEHQLADGGPLLRGIVDRLDVAPDGALRVVDYKTGKSPRPGFESSALFQMRFYGLVLWRERGVLPKMLQLVYLGDGQVLRAEPHERELEVTEQKVRSVWQAVERAARTGEFTPRRSRLCGWCAHQAVCPEFGGTPPALDPALVAERLGVDVGTSPAGREPARPLLPVAGASSEPDA
ncbi:exodeoxyribonuclease V subunit beta [Xylanimonas oleitrophica]|uniref:Exodeoxyribonuclease V subunit beta n=1 Tax=Xylanimonas oleitrophica TaxID=2607479 RepID=A0A2W5WW22_9MICO|nr:PD-(D/E)XK nuclease family protein [Xylanimonas oleitrophica]PZR52486.1 exodeoxyribonuclease V subunit beta [Xylanimonas oleitrophica]